MKPHAMGGGIIADDLQVALLEDASNVVDFYARHFERLNYAQREHLEHQVLWVYRHSRTVKDDEEEVIVSALYSLSDSIQRFRTVINADERFVEYKTLVGYESVFDPAWTDDDFDLSAVGGYRSEKIDGFVEDIDASNAAQWLNLIKTCASTQSNDLATFPKFGEFLQKLASKKPDILVQFLDQEEDLLAGFLTSILLGMEEAGRDAEIRARMRAWAEHGKFLRQIIWAFRAAKSVDSNLLRLASARACDAGDRNALHNAITVVDVRNHEIDDDLIDELLIPVIEKLSAMRHFLGACDLGRPPEFRCAHPN